MNLLPADVGRKIRFELSAEPGSRVFVAGTFNEWSPTATPLKDNPGSGHCKVTVRVPRGTHEYKFIVNGVWSMDPKCADTVPNAFGSENNVIHV